MKRLRSKDDLNSHGNKNMNPNPNRSSSSSHRSFCHRSTSDNNLVRKGLVSSSGNDRDRHSFPPEDEVGNRESGSRVIYRKQRLDHDYVGGFENRRKGFDNRCRADRIYRSESFSFTRREFPKRFRSERERRRREDSMSLSWRRFGSSEKEFGGDERERGGSGRWRERKGESERGREREMEKNVKSPSWSRDSGSEPSRVRGVGGVDSRDSRSKSRSKSSPTWSKDSSRSSVGEVVKKKEEEMQGETKNGSEMEEGELKPDDLAEPESGTNPSGVGNKRQEVLGFNGDHRESAVENGPREVEHEDEDKKTESVEEADHDTSLKEEEPVVKEVVKVGVNEKNLDHNARANHNGDEIIGMVDSGGETKEKLLEEIRELELERSSDVVVEKNEPLEEKLEPDKRIELEVNAEDINVPESNKEGAEDSGGVEPQGLSLNGKDKGKSIAITPTHVADSTGDVVWAERESISLITCRKLEGNDDMEGPSTRVFDLFTCSPVRKSDKPEQPDISKLKDDKLALGPLNLSLSLPDVLLPVGAKDGKTAPGSPSRAPSFQSFGTAFCTNSDGFTASVSCSGSQTFYHNPSCSLTHNSMDNCEQSVHSRLIFKEIDQISGGAWQEQSHNVSGQKDVPLYQKVLMNGNGSLNQTQALQGRSNGQNAQGQYLRATEGSSKMPNRPDRQSSFQNQKDMRSPSQSLGFRENGSNYSVERKKANGEKHGGSLYRSNSLNERDQLLNGGAEYVETLIGHIVSDPIHVTAKKFHGMAGQHISIMKESVRDIILNMDNNGQLHAFQSAIRNRTDINLEVLLKCHRALLEILVALKTALPELLRLDKNISSSDLAEIFLNLRCKNLSCKSLLPVDECECQVCAKNDGFCSTCMCLVCGKFDYASNTCSWVGCDVCLHWCHADCGLRESYIRNGNNATGAGSTEMQFHCVACGHASEMFGFVKEVFQNFAREWTYEKFYMELKCVRRIFSASRDLRGKRLHEIADQMLARLANKSNLSGICKNIMGFLTESNPSNMSKNPSSMEKEPVTTINRITRPSQESSWFKSVHSEKAPQQGRSSRQTDKSPIVEMGSQRNVHREPVFEELESIVKIKVAEAEMFQTRADDARREAEDLKRIAATESEKIEEQYANRIAKLRLVEAEAINKKKREEFQAVERAHGEYLAMKLRMEEDIKDLLSKMEATRRNLAL